MEYTIYSITCIDAKVKGIYVGSTKYFANRKNEHKAESKTKNHRKLYKCINSNGGLSNWEFKIRELFTVKHKLMRLLKNDYGMTN